VPSLLAHLAHGNAGDELSSAVAAFARGALARTGAAVAAAAAADRPSSADEGAAFASGGDAGVSNMGAHGAAHGSGGGGGGGGSGVAYLPGKDVNAVMMMLSGARGLQLQVGVESTLCGSVGAWGADAVPSAATPDAAHRRCSLPDSPRGGRSVAVKG
jgi:hypothetical protein